MILKFSDTFANHQSEIKTFQIINPTNDTIILSDLVFPIGFEGRITGDHTFLNTIPSFYISRIFLENIPYFMTDDCDVILHDHESYFEIGKGNSQGGLDVEVIDHITSNDLRGDYFLYGFNDDGTKSTVKNFMGKQINGDEETDVLFGRPVAKFTSDPSALKLSSSFASNSITTGQWMKAEYSFMIEDYSPTYFVCQVMRKMGGHSIQDTYISRWSSSNLSFSFGNGSYYGTRKFSVPVSIFENGMSYRTLMDYKNLGYDNNSGRLRIYEVESGDLVFDIDHCSSSWTGPWKWEIDTLGFDPNRNQSSSGFYLWDVRFYINGYLRFSADLRDATVDVGNRTLTNTNVTFPTDIAKESITQYPNTTITERLVGGITQTSKISFSDLSTIGIDSYTSKGNNTLSFFGNGSNVDFSPIIHLTPPSTSSSTYWGWYETFTLDSLDATFSFTTINSSNYSVTYTNNGTDVRCTVTMGTGTTEYKDFALSYFIVGHKYSTRVLAVSYFSRVSFMVYDDTLGTYVVNYTSMDGDVIGSTDINVHWDKFGSSSNTGMEVTFSRLRLLERKNVAGSLVSTWLFDCKFDTSPLVDTNELVTNMDYHIGALDSPPAPTISGNDIVFSTGVDGWVHDIYLNNGAHLLLEGSGCFDVSDIDFQPISTTDIDFNIIDENTIDGVYSHLLRKGYGIKTLEVPEIESNIPVAHFGNGVYVSGVAYNILVNSKVEYAIIADKISKVNFNYRANDYAHISTNTTLATGNSQTLRIYSESTSVLVVTAGNYSGMQNYKIPVSLLTGGVAYRFKTSKTTQWADIKNGTMEIYNLATGELITTILENTATRLCSITFDRIGTTGSEHGNYDFWGLEVYDNDLIFKADLYDLTCQVGGKTLTNNGVTFDSSHTWPIITQEHENAELIPICDDLSSYPDTIIAGEEYPALVKGINNAPVSLDFPENEYMDRSDVTIWKDDARTNMNVDYNRRWRADELGNIYNWIMDDYKHKFFILADESFYDLSGGEVVIDGEGYPTIQSPTVTKIKNLLIYMRDLTPTEAVKVVKWFSTVHFNNVT